MQRSSLYGLGRNPIRNRPLTVSQLLSQIKFNYRCRVVILGAAKVGKTAIIQQFVHDRLPKKHKKTVEDLFVAEYNIPNGDSLTFEILDTAGSYEFPAMRALSISNGDAFLLVYSVDDEGSWERIEDLRNQIIGARGRDIPIVIVANKSDEYDVERIVKRDVVESTMMCWGGPHVECSAKENINIILIFERILVQLNVNFDLNEAIYQSQHTNQNQTNAHACFAFVLRLVFNPMMGIRMIRNLFELNT